MSLSPSGGWMPEAPVARQKIRRRLAAGAELGHMSPFVWRGSPIYRVRYLAIRSRQASASIHGRPSARWK
jgi:hypothetical protein